MKNKAQAVQSQPAKRALSLEQIERENALYQIYLHGREGKPRYSLLLGVIAFHALLLGMTIPTFSVNILPKSEKKIIQVRQWTPPPPPKRDKPREVQVEKLKTVKIPIPDPTPDDPEPIEEPEPEPEPEPLPFLDPNAEYVLGAPEPPPSEGPLMAGIGDVSVPVLIESTRVQPEYPELARQAKVQGKVILQAVIFKDGSVSDIQVLQTPGEKLGFDESAVAAVRQWRYKPALQSGRPVDVIFTIVIDFTLR